MAIKSGQLKEKEDYQKYILEALSEDNDYQIRPATSFSAGYGRGRFVCLFRRYAKRNACSP